MIRFPNHIIFAVKNDKIINISDVKKINEPDVQLLLWTTREVYIIIKIKILPIEQV